MLIVPDNDALSVQAKVSPNDIDELSPDQPVALALLGLQYPNDAGAKWESQLDRADQIEDKQTGDCPLPGAHCVPQSELARLNGLKIIPGMPVEAFIQTESRTALSYLLKPLTDQVMRTFKES